MGNPRRATSPAAAADENIALDYWLEMMLMMHERQMAAVARLEAMWAIYADAGSEDEEDDVIYV